MKPLIIRRFEHDFLRVGENGFSRSHFAKLVSFNDRHGSEFFTVGHERIKFRNYVGVLQVGNLTIELLPKLDRGMAGGDAERDGPLMRDLLIRMLHRVGALPLENADSASLKRVSGGLFELYLRLFLQEVRGILSQGMPKRYSSISGNAAFLHGRLLVPQQLTHNLIHKERFYIESQRYASDHVFNRILKKALTIVSGLCCRASEEAQSLLASFEGVKSTEIRPGDFARLRYTRNMECYRDAIGIAELIIMNYQPDIQFGHLHVAAMLFDMNRLFEAYVAHELSFAARRSGADIAVRTQVSRHFWRSDHGSASKAIRPDLLVTLADGRVFVLDTKWKVIDGFQSADADLKQLYAYSLQFNAENVILVYPSCRPGLEVSWGHFSAAAVHGRLPIAQWKLSLVSDGMLNCDVGRMILEALAASASPVMGAGEEERA